MSENEKKKKPPKVMRATFEDVKNDQEKMRVWLDNLVETNEFTLPEKQGMFFRLLANSTLGLGTRIDVSFSPADQKSFGLDDRHSVPIKNIEDLLRFLAYRTKQPNVESMSFWWEKARSLLFNVFPHVLEFATKLSLERIPHEALEVTERW